MSHIQNVIELLEAETSGWGKVYSAIRGKRDWSEVDFEGWMGVMEKTDEKLCIFVSGVMQRWWYSLEDGEIVRRVPQKIKDRGAEAERKMRHDVEECRHVKASPVCREDAGFEEVKESGYMWLNELKELEGYILQIKTPGSDEFVRSEDGEFFGTMVSQDEVLFEDERRNAETIRRGIEVADVVRMIPIEESPFKESDSDD